MKLFNKSNLKSFLILLFLLVLNVGGIKAATIKGRVVDATTHESVIGATVHVKKEKKFTVTDVQGNYEISGLKIGSFEIEAKSAGFIDSYDQIIVISDNNDIKTFDIYLKPKTTAIDEVKVFATKVIETDISARTDERLASNVINIVSAKTIESLPDLNVANVMQRVSGVSMIKNSVGNNTDAVIRGMPPRYNSVLINGTSAPSTSGSTRSVPLDIIPSNLVGRVEVTKALTPDQEGSGIGGTVNIEMKDAPDKPLFSVDVASGYNQYFFDHKLLTFNSSVVNMKDPAALHGNDYLSNLSDFTRENMIITQKQANPDLSGSFSFGRRFFDNKLGLIISGTASNSDQGNKSSSFSYTLNTNNSGDLTSKSVVSYFTQSLRTGSNVKFDYLINNKNKISLHSSIFRLQEDRVRKQIDTTSEINWGRVGLKDVTNIDISSLMSANLQGHHEILPNLEIDWSVIYSIATSQSPDLVTTNYIQIIHPTVQPIYLNYTGSVSRVWQHNNDEDKTGYLNIKYKPTIFDHLVEFKIGGMARSKYRINYANEYTFDAPIDNPANPDINTVEVTQNRNAQQRNGNPVNNPGNYKATEDIQALYFQLKTSFGKLQILTGARIEFTYQTNYHSETQNVLVPFTRNRYNYYDLLPSLHLNYQLSENQNIRASAYQGISRPNYTELVDFYAQSVFGGATGNSKLNHTQATCIDARYEIYPDKEEVFTGGIFFKNIAKPIEDALGGNNVTQPVNLKTPCKNYGIELVGLKYFGNIGFSANYTYTKSVIVSQRLYYTSDTSYKYVNINRPLLNQAPHIINLALIYRDVDRGLNCQLVYTLQGESWKNLSTYYGQDIIQKTFQDLGATVDKRLYNKLLLYVKANNLLNYKLQYYYTDGLKYKDVSTSLSFLIGLKYNL